MPCINVSADALILYEHVKQSLAILVWVISFAQYLPLTNLSCRWHFYSDINRSYMIRHKLPGPYEDTVGPTVLGIMLMVSITAQFAIKLVELDSTF